MAANIAIWPIGRLFFENQDGNWIGQPLKKVLFRFRPQALFMAMALPGQNLPYWM